MSKINFGHDHLIVANVDWLTRIANLTKVEEEVGSFHVLIDQRSEMFAQIDDLREDMKARAFRNAVLEIAKSVSVSTLVWIVLWCCVCLYTKSS